MQHRPCPLPRKGLRRYEFATGKHEDVRSADWDITDVAFSHNGKYRIDMTNADGATVVELFDVASGQAVALPRLPAGEIRNVRISRSEARMAFYVNIPQAPHTGISSSNHG